jgi:hypothetical protein
MDPWSLMLALMVVFSLFWFSHRMDGLLERVRRKERIIHPCYTAELRVRKAGGPSHRVTRPSCAPAAARRGCGQHNQDANGDGDEHTDSPVEAVFGYVRRICCLALMGVLEDPDEENSLICCTCMHL